MLKYNIKNLMRLRGITRPYTFLKRKGFSRNMASRLGTEKLAGITPWQIEKLCIVLKCLPSDLFFWEADKGEQATESHPLWKIRKQEVKSVSDVGKRVAAEKMGEFLDAVKAVEEKFKAG